MLVGSRYSLSNYFYMIRGTEGSPDCMQFRLIEPLESWFQTVQSPSQERNCGSMGVVVVGVIVTNRAAIGFAVNRNAQLVSRRSPPVFR